MQCISHSYAEWKKVHNLFNEWCVKNTHAWKSKTVTLHHTQRLSKHASKI